MASRTRWERSMSAWMRVRASFWLRGSTVSSFRLRSALLNRTGRC
ncbi:MAG: hypothetical protein QOE61_4363 [Micromonosporaceae bacterium]|nr:hypothetical protein [Micromonosporaceae bacterium]